MLHVKKCLAALILTTTAFCANSGNLWIIGDATPYGWTTDDATALLSVAENPEYTGTIYLKAGQDFKFMTVPDFGNEEYGALPGATLENGVIAIAKGTDDNGYTKLQVAEDGNYLIKVNTETMTASIVKSDYQESQITLSSLFIVGDAAPEGWDVMKGSPLYQNPEKPYEFKTEGITLKAASFKIAAELKGACSFNQKYWYFRDAADENKIAKNQDGDLQWTIAEEGVYTVTVNVADNTIAIVANGSSSVATIESDNVGEPEYYTLTGIKVNKPESGIYICKNGTKVHKVVIR